MARTAIVGVLALGAIAALVAWAARDAPGTSAGYRVPPSEPLVVIAVDHETAAFEGAVSYVEVRGRAARLLQVPHARVLSHRTMRGSYSLRQRLRPGSYRLHAWLRTCAGTCRTLDPPSRRCTVSFEARRGATTRLRVEAADPGRCEVA